MITRISHVYENYNVAYTMIIMSRLSSLIANKITILTVFTRDNARGEKGGEKILAN